MQSQLQDSLNDPVLMPKPEGTTRGLFSPDYMPVHETKVTGARQLKLPRSAAGQPSSSMRRCAMLFGPSAWDKWYHADTTQFFYRLVPFCGFRSTLHTLLIFSIPDTVCTNQVPNCINEHFQKEQAMFGLQSRAFVERTEANLDGTANKLSSGKKLEAWSTWPNICGFGENFEIDPYCLQGLGILKTNVSEALRAKLQRSNTFSLQSLSLKPGEWEPMQIESNRLVNAKPAGVSHQTKAK